MREGKFTEISMVFEIKKFFNSVSNIFFTFFQLSFQRKEKNLYFQRKIRGGKAEKSEGVGKVGEMSSSAGARSVLGNMTNLRAPDTGLLRPSVKTHVTGGQ